MEVESGVIGVGRVVGVAGGVCVRAKYGVVLRLVLWDLVFNDGLVQFQAVGCG